MRRTETGEELDAAWTEMRRRLRPWPPVPRDPTLCLFCGEPMDEACSTCGTVAPRTP